MHFSLSSVELQCKSKYVDDTPQFLIEKIYFDLKQKYLILNLLL